MFAIGGWDYASYSCGREDNVPVFYFIPDYEFISFLNINGYRHIPVRIEGSEEYDGEYWITMDKQPDTVWYTGFIHDKSFTGYPAKNGSVSLNLPTQYVPTSKLSCVVNGCC